jgi:hypothetical protein
MLISRKLYQPYFDRVYLIGENKNINEFVEILKNEHDLEIDSCRAKYIYDLTEHRLSKGDKTNAIRVAFLHGSRTLSIKKFLDSFHTYRSQSGNKNTIYLYITDRFYQMFSAEMSDIATNLLCVEGVKHCASISEEEPNN